jgi:hypothetical protein
MLLEIDLPNHGLTFMAVFFVQRFYTLPIIVENIGMGNEPPQGGLPAEAIGQLGKFTSQTITGSRWLEHDHLLIVIVVGNGCTSLSVDPYLNRKPSLTMDRHESGRTTITERSRSRPTTFDGARSVFLSVHRYGRQFRAHIYS